MNKKTIQEIDVTGKRVLVRVDFNVPLSSKNPADAIYVTDDTRIKAALPTLNHLLAQNAIVILCSHVGRPKSTADTQFSTKPIATRLSDLLGRPVTFIPAVVGDVVTAAIAAAQAGDVLMLENTRFEKGEEKNDVVLSEQLGALADVYVNDAFGSAHRAHSSTEGVAHIIRAKGGDVVAGFLIGKELAALGMAVTNPPHPYIAIMGGAKISDKIKLIENLLDKADKILIGGGMANTFISALGHQTGKSLVEATALDEARRLLNSASDRLILPVDVVVTSEFNANDPTTVVSATEIPADKMALDIGPATVALFAEQLNGAKLVIWNGPMGVFEFDSCAVGTFAIARILADAADQGANVVIGGGDSAAAVAKAGLEEKMSHVSTGGGASLELLEGRILPGIAVLDEL